MGNTKDQSLEDKVKQLSVEQQLYVKGLIDGALLHIQNLTTSA